MGWGMGFMMWFCIEILPQFILVILFLFFSTKIVLLKFIYAIFL